MTAEPLQVLARLLGRDSLYAYCAGAVADHDLRWRHADWDERLASQSIDFWTYKAADCVHTIVEFQRNLDWPSYCRWTSAGAALHVIAYLVSDLWRGAWILECEIAGAIQATVSEGTLDLAIRTLDRAQTLLDVHRRARRIAPALRAELCNMTNELLSHYLRLQSRKATVRHSSALPPRAGHAQIQG